MKWVGDGIALRYCMKMAGTPVNIKALRSVSDEAIQSEVIDLPQSLDCFVTAFLAMTGHTKRLFQK